MTSDSLPFRADFGLVRCARPADAGRIVAMVERLAAHHGGIATLTEADLVRDSAGDHPWLHLLVAEADGALVGYAALCGLIRLQFGLRGLDLHHLFTEPTFRGRGVGQALVEGAKARAMALSCGYMTVGTHPDNRKAQAFYEGLGFSRLNAHPPRFSITLTGSGAAAG